jgi:N-acetylmuramoyl-L-alanine amidase
MLIVLDAGHGLANVRPNTYDPGAVAGGQQEAKIALAWVATLKYLLGKRGVKVMLTRVSDTDPAPLRGRVRDANEAGADLFISFHLNAANGKARGTETLYRDQADARLATVVQGAAVGAFKTLDATWKDRGVKGESESARGRLAVFGVTCPACLLEIGFIDNEADRALIGLKETRVAVCQSIADAVCEAYGDG